MAFIVQADKVIFEHHDNYQKQSYRNRIYIATANGKLTLNIPVKHNKSSNDHKKTAEALIENSFLWQRQHWRSIQIAYRTSPFFEFYEDELEPLYTREYEKLLHFNETSINIILEALQVEIERTNTLAYNENPEALDLRFLADAKRKDKIEIPAYNQVFQEKQGFIPHLSIIDLLFNEGPNALNYLENLKLNF
tara:strand:+ start:988 stop:1566 length:579 start_codon:yes stop_codon:yes gene_type:complete